MTVLDSGFHAVDSGIRVMNSGFQSLVGFRIPKLGIPRISEANFSQIPESGYPCMGRNFAATPLLIACVI